MSVLPDGWRWVHLQDICTVILGQSPPGSSYNENSEGLPFFQGKAEFGARSPTVRKWTTAGTKLAIPGDILISVRAPVGPTNVADVHCAIGRGLAALRASPGVHPEYLLLSLRASEHQLARMGTGSTFAAISGAVLREHMIPLAPLAEQQRIVEVTQDLLSRLETSQNYVRASEKRIASVRRAAGSDLLDGPWPMRKLSEITDNHDGQRIPLKNADRAVRQGPYPYYGASGVIDSIDDFIFDGEYLLIAEDGANLATRSKPIAFTARGQFWVNNHAHVVTPTQDVRLEYMELAINQLDIQRSITGSAQPKLTQANLKRLEVPVPPLEAQDQIVTTYERMALLTETLGDELSRTGLRVRRLRSSILAAAFSGRLTSQEAESV